MEVELELENAKSVAELAAKKRERLAILQKESAIPQSALSDAEREGQSAQLRVERAKTLLDLYRKADPKNATPGESTASPTSEPR